MEWISTKDRLPKRADAGHYREVVALAGGPHMDPDFQDKPELIAYHLVRKTRHTHWASLDEPPEETA